MEQAGRQAACPGEEVTFTCVVIEGAALWWIAEPHITQSDPVTFSVATATAGETRDPTAEIHIVLDDVSRGSVPQVRDFVSTLTVRNSTALSGTVIQCSNGNFITASNTLSITGSKFVDFWFISQLEMMVSSPQPLPLLLRMQEVVVLSIVQVISLYLCSGRVQQVMEEWA